jgi:hypothetical protein
MEKDKNNENPKNILRILIKVYEPKKRRNLETKKRITFSFQPKEKTCSALIPHEPITHARAFPFVLSSRSILLEADSQEVK